MNAVDAANPSRYSRHARLLIVAVVLPVVASVLIAGGAVLGTTTLEQASSTQAEQGIQPTSNAESDLESNGRPAVALEDTGTGLPLQPPAPGSEPWWSMPLPLVAALLLGVLIVSGGLLRRTLRSLRDIDHDHAQLQREHQALQCSEERLRDLARGHADWMWETDEYLRISYMCPDFAAATGLPRDAWQGQPIELLLHCETLPTGQWLQQLGADRPGAGRLRCTYRDGAEQTRHCRIVARPIVRDQCVTGYRGTVVDITDEVAAQAQRPHHSMHDAVTGLGDEQALTRFLDQAVADRDRPSPLTLLLLDLQAFEMLTETSGQAAQDNVLRTVATRLRDSTRSDDLISRLSAGKFLIVLASIDERDEVDHFCQRLIDNVQRPIAHGEDHLQVAVNIGVVHVHPARSTACEWVRCANIALEQAKAEGDGKWRHFLADQDQQAPLRQLETDLAAAIKHEQLLLHFQPRYALDGKRIVAVEASLRWQHPVEGLLEPNVFLPLAERSDLIVTIGRWLLREACTAARQWPRNVAVSVNVSPAYFSRSDVSRDVRDALTDCRLPASRLHVQLAEQVLLECADGAIAALTALKELGVRLILDQFGSGYCSLGYLRIYPFDALKIDRRFIASMDRSEQDHALVRGIIDLGKAMGVAVIAAGVETEAQLQRLQQDRCHEGQGIYLGEAIDHEAIGRLLEQQTTSRRSPQIPQPGLHAR
jgi:diguanylate cyclase (GGDEF)-like protein/PAS domain S-box-containing protein